VRNVAGDYIEQNCQVNPQYGGAIYNIGVNGTVIELSLFEANTATRGGGAIAGAPQRILDSSFINNAAGEFGGAVFEGFNMERCDICLFSFWKTASARGARTSIKRAVGAVWVAPHPSEKRCVREL
jgi:hypothetical protein